MHSKPSFLNREFEASFPSVIFATNRVAPSFSLPYDIIKVIASDAKPRFLYNGFAIINCIKDCIDLYVIFKYKDIQQQAAKKY